MDNLTPVFVASTVLHWASLGVDPAIIKANSIRIKDRFEPTKAILSREPIAIVGFGPSLQESWPELKQYSTIITTSGAHKFLLEHGIVPRFHADAEPRPHKVAMLGDPHPDTTYLIASICASNYFDKLEAAHAKVKLWHVYMEDAESAPYLPNDEWLITGGNSIGPRAIKLARLMGYVNFHMYGLDGCGKHAATHTNEQPDHKFFNVRMHGKSFSTTDFMFEQANLLFNDLNYIPDATFTFHGEGLIQEIAKDWRYEFKAGYPLAVVKDG